MNKRGIAIILVITALAIMVLVAVPFLVSTRLRRQQSSRALEKTAAQVTLDGVLDLAKDGIYRCAPGSKPYLTGDDRADMYDSLSDLQPDLDSINNAIAELRPDEESSVESRISWNARVEDEQGKVNINAASPELIGRIFGFAEITSDQAEPGPGRNEYIIELDDPAQFYSDEDPDTVDGYVWINGEDFAYVDVDLDEAKMTILGEPVIDADYPVVVDARGNYLYEWRHQFDPPREFGSIYEIRDATFEDPNDGQLKHIPVRSDEMLRLEGLFTTRSWRPKPWSRWFEVTPVISVDSDGSQVSYLLAAKNIAPLLAFGQAIRLRSPDEQIENDTIDSFMLNNGCTEIYLRNNHAMLPSENSALVAEVEQFAPININTAPKDVLTAILGRIYFKGYAQGGMEETAPFVDYIMQYRTAGALKGFEDLLTTGYFGWKDDYWNEDIFERLIPLYSCRDASSLDSFFSPPPIVFSAENDFTIRAGAVYCDEKGFPLARASAAEKISSAMAETDGRFFRRYSDLHLALETGAAELEGWTTAPVPQPFVHPFVEDIWTGTGDFVLEPDHDYLSFKPEAIPSEFDDFFEMDAEETSGGGRTLPSYSSRGAWWDGLEIGVSDLLDNLKTPSIHKNGAALELHAWWLPTNTQNGKNIVLWDMSGGSGPILRLALRDRVSGFELTAAGDDMQGEVTTWLFDFDGNNFSPDYWHHVMLYFAGNRTNQAIIAVDGHPLVTKELSPNLAAQLSSALSQNDTGSTALENGGDQFPTKGYAWIGGEIIGYNSAGAGSIDVITRGACGTTAKDHYAGELVERAGFDLDADDDYDALDGRLAEKLSLTKPLGRLSANITATDTIIPASGLSGYQDSGFVKIDKEILYYNSRTTSQLNVLAGGRGKFGTTAAAHRNNARIIPVSICVEKTDVPGYTNPNNQLKFVQATGDGTTAGKVEWLRYDRVATENGKQYIVLVNDSGLGRKDQYDPMREGLGSARVEVTTIPPADELVPVHKSNNSQYKVLADPGGPFDGGAPVTFLDTGSGQRRQLNIKRFHKEGSDYYWAMSKNPQQTIKKNKRRMIRYPQGRPSYRGYRSRFSIGVPVGKDSENYTPLEGRFSDFISRTVQPRAETNLPAADPVDLDSWNVTADSLLQSWPHLVYIRTPGSSFEFFKDNDPGVDWTPGGRADYVGGVYMAQVTSVDSGLGQLQSVSSNTGAPPEIYRQFKVSGSGKLAPLNGTLWNRTSGEVFHYRSLSGGTVRSLLPMKARYGTEFTPIEEDDWLQQIPVRHWDGYVSASEGYGEKFIELADCRPGALWTGLLLKFDEKALYPYQEIEIRVVFDGKAVWSGPQSDRLTSDLDKVFIFKYNSLQFADMRGFPGSPEDYRQLSFTDSAWPDGVAADCVQARIYLKHRHNSFFESDDWKMTAKLQSWTFTCTKREQVLRRDVVE